MLTFYNATKAFNKFIVLSTFLKWFINFLGLNIKHIKHLKFTIADTELTSAHPHPRSNCIRRARRTCNKWCRKKFNGYDQGTCYRDPYLRCVCSNFDGSS